MFANLRWRITCMFVGLSAIVYVSLTALGLLIFEHGLTAAIDKQLKIILSEIGHAIDIENGNPKFRDWIRRVRTEPPRSLATIQLFDSSGRMLEHYGPVGVEHPFIDEPAESRNAYSSVRVLSSPLKASDTTLGFVQVQLSTFERDNVLKELRLHALVVGVLFLVAVTVIGYWIAKLITQPIRDSILILQSFMADASHELNTPLTILQARTESLERKLFKLGIQQEDLTIAAKSVQRLNQVVNDLLLLSEVEDPLSEIKKTPVNISSIIQQVINEMRNRFDAKDIELTVSDLPDIFVKGNTQALHRLFSNLLENALRYTDERGKVNVALTNSGKEARITVRDTGVGIPSESLPRIFDRFFRVDKSRSRASGGTGLGLAIAKAIADAHHGMILVESEIKRGSTFTVALPKLRMPKQVSVKLG